MRRSASRALILQEQDDIARIVRSVGQDLEQARWIHAQIEQSQHRRNRFLANLLVEMYGKCGRIREARAVFDGMVEQPNDFSWNILAWAYATNGQLAAAEEIFYSMSLRSSVSWTSMIQIYSHYSNPSLAEEVLGRMPEWNLISWNTLIAAYAQSGHLQESTEVFLAMPKRDVISWCSLLAGFALASDPSSAQRFFQRSPYHDRVSATSVLQVLGGDQGRVIFDLMEERDKISWNAMIAANWSSLEGARAR
ncbi:pentatricopeptide repeat-containing protein At2g35030, mitochondrial-like [Selaginella moellendorffii]|uniref:pentatricopeptide repeat-containing protein At2g35030, mitochondrial-like n=1 Tax=Selaginella moellendorffii TaxID=88036 RepID=UPI000D1C6F05|nr:pentatricopeptide repeat-containing protein At2g35030, mitochondrial-like [Selaginella moellendorffii]|eukprot:XP_024544772.1 pentatricopeptide repeat-containing protein At2g35030, mitochondrial-like [Selaginella moellendorffii]